MTEHHIPLPGRPSGLELLGIKERPRIEFPVLVRPALKVEREAAKKRLDEAEGRQRRLNAKSTLPLADLRESLADAIDEAKGDLDRIDEEIEAHTVVFVFEGLPSQTLIDLQAAHPPTDDQKAQFKKEGLSRQGLVLMYDETTYAPALVAASLVEPAGVTEDHILDMWFGPKCQECPLVEGRYETCAGRCTDDNRRPDQSQWTAAELRGLWIAANSVNNAIAAA